MSAAPVLAVFATFLSLHASMGVGCRDVSHFDGHLKFCTIQFPDFKSEQDDKQSTSTRNVLQSECVSAIDMFCTSNHYCLRHLYFYFFFLNGDLFVVDVH